MLVRLIFCAEGCVCTVVWFVNIGSFLQGDQSPHIVAAATEDLEVSCCLSLSVGRRALIYRLHCITSSTHTHTSSTTLPPCGQNHTLPITCCPSLTLFPFQRLDMDLFIYLFTYIVSLTHAQVSRSADWELFYPGQHNLFS